MSINKTKKRTNRPQIGFPSFSRKIALKIHLSEATKVILDTFGTFQVELRGNVELKGKGTVTTYWLTGSTEPDPRPPTPMKTRHEEAEVPFPILFPAIGK